MPARHLGGAQGRRDRGRAPRRARRPAPWPRRPRARPRAPRAARPRRRRADRPPPRRRARSARGARRRRRRRRPGADACGPRRRDQHVAIAEQVRRLGQRAAPEAHDPLAVAPGEVAGHGGQHGKRQPRAQAILTLRKGSAGSLRRRVSLSAPTPAPPTPARGAPGRPARAHGRGRRGRRRAGRVARLAAEAAGGSVAIVAPAQGAGTIAPRSADGRLAEVRRYVTDRLVDRPAQVPGAGRRGADPRRGAVAGRGGRARRRPRAGARGRRHRAPDGAGGADGPRAGARRARGRRRRRAGPRAARAPSAADAAMLLADAGDRAGRPSRTARSACARRSPIARDGSFPPSPSSSPARPRCRRTASYGRCCPPAGPTTRRGPRWPPPSVSPSA